MISKKTILFFLLCVILIVGSFGCLNGAKELSEIYLITVKQGKSTFELQPIDSNTLKNVSSKKPFDLGYNYATAVNDDGSKIAAIVWHKKKKNVGKIYVIDTNTWRVKDTGRSLKYLVSRLKFSRDGRYILWVEPAKKAQGYSSKISDKYQLKYYDLQTAKIKTIAKFDKYFAPDKLHFASDDDKIAVYGPNINSKFEAQGPPSIYTLSINKRKILNKIRINGVKAGVVDSTVYVPAVAADKTSKNAAYIVNEKNNVFIIDLAKGKLKAMKTIKGMGKVVAKGASLIERSALLSGDGKNLFITGYSNQENASKGATSVQKSHLGLKIVNTSTWKTEFKYSIRASNIYLTPDNKQLVTFADYDFENNKANAGIYLYDAVAMKKQGYIGRGIEYRFGGFSTDSKKVYISYSAGSMQGHNLQVVLRILDLEGKKSKVSRVVEGFVADLLVPGSQTSAVR